MNEQPLVIESLDTQVVVVEQQTSIVTSRDEVTVVAVGIAGPPGPKGDQGDPGVAADHGDLTGLSDNDHPQYLLVTDIDDTPVNGEVAQPISSNWAFDHLAAADPHPGYLTEAEGDAAYADITEPIAAAHISDSTAAHAASAISIADVANDFTATDVEGALAELQADAEADAQALADHLTDTTNVHDHGSLGGLQGGTTDEYYHLTQAEDAAFANATGAGNVVLSTSPTIDDSLTLDGYLDLVEIAAPGTPASGNVVLYAKTDGLLYSKDDAGVETPLDSLGSSQRAMAFAYIGGF